MSHSRVEEKDSALRRQTKNGISVSGKENLTVDWNHLSGKRKAVDYEEDIEGFQFSRTSRSSKRPRSSSELTTEESVTKQPSARSHGSKGKLPNLPGSGSLSNAPGKTEQTHHLSKRPPRDKSDTSKAPKKKPLPSGLTAVLITKKGRPVRSVNSGTSPGVAENNVERGTVTPPQPTEVGTTKISLPFADTPVIQRNKEMREERGKGKGKRRSSFGMRGRRASFLIDSGASNALPHDKVDTADFYKHIESEDLSEPKRMRQLLTWCATRAMGEKPSGSRSNDESAKLSARVIQEEILKEFSSRSELSDWLSREETTPPAVVVKMPNPKNVQNSEKIKELEDHIQRLQAERQSLASLLRPPSISALDRSHSETLESNIPLSAQKSAALDLFSVNRSLLDACQAPVLDAVQSSTLSPLPQSQPTPLSSENLSVSNSISPLTTRLSLLSSSLAPVLDSFAAGIHDLELYRSTADNFAGGVLRACASRLEEKELQALERRYASKYGSPGEVDDGGGFSNSGLGTEDLQPVLGALSRLERR